MGEGADVFSLDNTRTLGTPLSVFVAGDLQLSMGGQPADLLEVESTDAATSIHIGGRFRVKNAANVDLNGAGGSADLLHMSGNPNQFDDLFVASGQGGDDTVDDDPGTHYANPPVFKAFETVQ